MNEHAHIRKNDAGLTLIEIMIAVVVMTGGILALMSSVINLANQNDLTARVLMISIRCPLILSVPGNWPKLLALQTMTAVIF